jgi:hypothetical protein
MTMTPMSNLFEDPTIWKLAIHREAFYGAYEMHAPQNIASGACKPYVPRKFDYSVEHANHMRHRNMCFCGAYCYMRHINMVNPRSSKGGCDFVARKYDVSVAHITEIFAGPTTESKWSNFCGADSHMRHQNMVFLLCI